MGRPINSVTGNAKIKPATKRQQKRRALLKAAGIKEISFKLKPAFGQVLAESMVARSCTGEPYTVEEYICSLIREDAARLKGQIADAQRYPCKQCGKTLPTGCGGVFKGELACLHTPTAWKLLIPTVVV